MAELWQTEIPMRVVRPRSVLTRVYWWVGRKLRLLPPPQVYFRAEIPPDLHPGDLVYLMTGQSPDPIISGNTEPYRWEHD